MLRPKAIAQISGAIVLLLASPIVLAQAPVVPAALSTWDIVFYTFFFSALVFYSVAMVLLKEYTWLTYSVYGLLLMVLVASLDGTLSVLFDGDRWMMAYGPLFIGSVTAGFGFFHTAYRIEASHWLAGLKPLYRSFALLGLALIPGYYLLDSPVPLYATLNTLLLLVALAQIFPPLTWTEITPEQHRLALIWPVATIAFAVALYSFHFLGPGFDRPTLDFANRLVLVLHVAHLFSFTGIAILDQKRARQEATRQAEIAAREAAEAELARERSERAYAEAQALASSRSRQLAAASHDLKQPIAALRHAIDAHRSEVTSQQNERIHDAVNYLDQLASTYLELGNDGIDGTDGTSAELERDNAGRETVSVSLLLKTIASMFEQDAAEQDIEIRRFDSKAKVHVSPLALSRALANILSNAIAHAKPRQILLGCRFREDQLRIEIYDNGRGMSPEELEAATHLRQRGAESDGSGLGLPTVIAVAEQEGWPLDITSTKGSGTRVSLLVPAA
ncbi:MAG: HAMP domain-containing sensor histidine kinase [Pseudomonadota bacterium]